MRIQRGLVWNNRKRRIYVTGIIRFDSLELNQVRPETPPMFMTCGVQTEHKDFGCVETGDIRSFDQSFPDYYPPTPPSTPIEEKIEKPLFVAPELRKPQKPRELRNIIPLEVPPILPCCVRAQSYRVHKDHLVHHQVKTPKKKPQKPLGF